VSQTPTNPDLVTVNIDGRDIAVPKGTNMIEAAALLGIEIPHFCYHPKLPVSGNCRMCLVEMGTPAVDPATKQPVLDAATGKEQIRWMPKPQIACFTNATPGLHIRTNTPAVRECRAGVMEFLLVNHPLDCPICDQAGECKLQEQSADYGRGASRFIEPKNVKPKRTQLGPRVTLDDERCILCSRCIRFTRDIAKQDVLGFVDRGSYSTLTCYPGHELDHNYSLNTVDICPVGALTSTDFRFKMRVWFLKTTPSVCTESSVGVNTELWAREGVIYRITPRRNDEVNDTWMPDSGRVLYKRVADEKRLVEPRIGGRAATPDAALAAAVELLRSQPGTTAIVGSGRQSIEEQFLTKQLAHALGSVPCDIVGRVGKGDGFLISADRNPNTRGALVTGLLKAYPPPTVLTELADAIDHGAVKTVVTFGEDLAAAGLTAERLAKIAIIAVGTRRNPTTDIAKILIPSLTVFERRGSFLNQQFRLQRFDAAVPGPSQALDDLAILRRLIAGVGDADAKPATPDAVWAELAAQVPVLAGLTWSAIPSTGKLIDGSAWARESFVEGETLHFKPAAKPAAHA